MSAFRMRPGRGDEGAAVVIVGEVAGAGDRGAGVAVPALRRLLTAILDPAAIRKVLAALGLSALVPELAVARSLPGETGIECPE